MKCLKEQKIHTRRVRQQLGKTRVKINNKSNMDNHERFKNIVLGFSIQAERILQYIQTLSNEQREQLKQLTTIMKDIQRNLWGLGYIKDDYDKHLNNSIYCKRKMKPYAEALEKIIIETNMLVNNMEGR